MITSHCKISLFVSHIEYIQISLYVLYVQGSTTSADGEQDEGQISDQNWPSPRLPRIYKIEEGKYRVRNWAKIMTSPFIFCSSQ